MLLTTFSTTLAARLEQQMDLLIPRAHEDRKRLTITHLHKLARDISTGSGETIDALAEIAAIPQDQRTTFARTLQSNYGKIYTSAKVTDKEVAVNLAKFVPAA